MLDARDKMSGPEFRAGAAELGLDEGRTQRFEQVCRQKYAAGQLDELAKSLAMDAPPAGLAALDERLRAFGIADWCEYDLGIVRGLAYYTGTVFEAHETTGVERAIAGGGRYDQLIELFDGPSLPAVGFGMGDVVLTNLLQDKGLLQPPEAYLPPVDVFVFAVSDAAGPRVAEVVAACRRGGLHARMSYKQTRNVGKLLKDAERCGALRRRAGGRRVGAEGHGPRRPVAGETGRVGHTDRGDLRRRRRGGFWGGDGCNGHGPTAIPLRAGVRALPA